MERDRRAALADISALSIASRFRLPQLEETGGGVEVNPGALKERTWPQTSRGALSKHPPRGKTWSPA